MSRFRTASGSDRIGAFSIYDLTFFICHLVDEERASELLHTSAFK